MRIKFIQLYYVESLLESQLSFVIFSKTACTIKETGLHFTWISYIVRMRFVKIPVEEADCKELV